MPELHTGDVLDGRYRVLSRVGSGGMADVYLAEDEQLGRRVALKLLHRRFAEDPGFVERFRREARAAAALAHPNVVAVYDRGSWDGTYYIAMEYLPGRSLKQLISQEAPLEPVRAIDIAVQILKAARFAHRHGVIHRDLKPHNVIVDDSGHAKVTDFGIARAGASDMTETGSIMGTAQYLSPEQAQGLAVGPASDLYSVGVVLYEMLTGHVPFESESAVTIALRHVSEAPRPPSQLAPGIPPELEQVVLWALNKDPADRPHDAEQFIDVLCRVRESILAAAHGERTASMPALAAAMPFVPPSAAAPPPPLALSRETHWQRPAPVSGNGADPAGGGRPRRRWPWIVAAALVLAAAGAAAAILLSGATPASAQVLVPKVVGYSLPVAQAKLQDADLVAAVQYENNSAPRNQVVKQDPLADARVRRGSTVTLYVSSGPGNVTIPSVVGESRAQAIHRLERAGVTVASVQQRPSSTVAAGLAEGTDPRSGTPVALGTAVTLFVSSGPPKVQVPSLRGDSQAAATQALRQAGLQVAVVRKSSQTVPAGHVISQSPAAGAMATKGSTVTIYLSSGPPTVAVPDTRGQTLAAARRTLQAAGLKVALRRRAVSSRARQGTVIAQIPASGRRPKGSTVTLVIGRYQPAPPPSRTTTQPSSTTPTTTRSPTTPTTTKSSTTSTTSGPLGLRAPGRSGGRAASAVRVNGTAR
jgi:beta-lactam-binding protein with PASTA domain/predicted Ser/Thr protein kinase